MAYVCGVTSLAERSAALYLSVICGGFSYGGFWGLMPSIASEVLPPHLLLIHGLVARIAWLLGYNLS